MIYTYIKIAWRNLVHQKQYAIINIAGLAVGMASFILITVFVRHELSFDKFNEKADRVYRIDNEIKFGGNHFDLASSSPLVGQTAKAELPGIEGFTRIRWHGDILIKKGTENIKEGRTAWTDATIFEVFTLPLIAGDPDSVLSKPGSIVINETIARKYFNSTDVVGKMMTVNNNELRKITGVMKDIPGNSHFQFNIFFPNVDDPSAAEPTWAGSQNWNTYLLVKPGTDAGALSTQLNRLMDKHLEPQLKQVLNKSLAEFKSSGDFFKMSLMPLSAIHLRSNKISELNGVGSLQNIYIFSAIAIFILAIACINFMNLSTARSAKRAREVGIRKVLGSQRKSIIVQFMAESILTALFAMLLAVMLVYFSIPAFSNLMGTAFRQEALFTGTGLVAGLGLVLVVGLIAGSYPAFYLSSFIPIKVLKSNTGSGSSPSLFRNVLVVFQFSASLILVAGTLVIYSQMDYIRNKDIGYNRDQLLVINNTSPLGTSLPSFRNQLEQLNGVEKISYSGYLPVNYNRNNNLFFPNRSLSVKDAIGMQNWTVDDNYIPTLEMKIAAGRNFSQEMKTDSTGMILNESAARFLGGNVIGKELYEIVNEETRELKTYHVIGVVKDFNFSSFRDKVQPLAFTYGQDAGSATIKIHSSQIPKLLGEIRTIWKTYSQDPFDYSFMDEDYNKQLEGELRTGQLFSVFSVLAIFIACLGIFGLATYMAAMRTREIGIRKVLGASIFEITKLLSGDYLRLIIIASVIAIPIAFLLMSKWLREFAYRVQMDLSLFLVAGLTVLVLAIITVSFQTIRAALANPVKSLRSE